jgi:hypothetical protein
MMTATAASPKLPPTTTRFRQMEPTSRRELCDATTDYFTKYYALHHLRCVADEDPTRIDASTVAAVQQLFQNEAFSRQRQSLFFFRQAAEVFTSMVTCSDDADIAGLAIGALRQVLRSTSGNGHRAAVEAIGSLPTAVRGPRLNCQPMGFVPQLKWQELLSSCGLRCRQLPVAIGRSLVSPIESEDRLLVVKLAKRDDTAAQMILELEWMRHLNRCRKYFPDSFLIPVPIEAHGRDLFRLASLPAEIPGAIDIQPELTAIAFVAPESYFHYPNTHDPACRPTPGRFRTMMRENAYLFARLASRGIVHSAPIALFHNRIQVERRRDRGRYEWFRAGRLDRWLSSCDFPNMGASGLRDFEHLLSFNGSSQALYRHIGNHILSLLLVAGSYFRNAVPQQRGLGPCGKPVDARHLFDKELFQTVIAEMLSAYYEGFVGVLPSNGIPLDLSRLTIRLVDELGVDRYMDEILRAADQDQMSDDAFERFLLQRGYPHPGEPKGAADISIRTGPHLGGFNQSISAPELIEAVGVTAAWCIAGSYWQLKFGLPL